MPTMIEAIAGEYKNLVILLVSCPNHGVRIVVRPMYWTTRLGEDVMITLAEAPAGYGLAVVSGGTA
ncbi:hypothetical protein LCGC14_0748610 [marine sediment metagenome]|uniref:Uncharacterized protein n=1 Tax=marine sediment metagenome TaxID=412755 RepID=A0A0F9Q4L1_9ZZZZ